MIFETTTETKEMAGNELKKYRQKKKILQLLYSHENLSGPVISKRLGVSLPTVLSLMNELTESDFVEIKGAGKSSGGRKPTLFGLSDDSLFVVACELGRYSGKVTIYNPHNRQITPVITFETSIDDDKLTDKIYENVQELIENNSIKTNRILGVGLTMPGLIDEETGINYTIKNSVFRNVKERLENKFGKMVYVNNDARMQSYGEYIFGAAKGHPNAIVVNWSWGVGLGIIVGGKLYNGANGFAGELSHIQLVENGNLCICGKRGCLETVTSAYVLLREAVKGIKENKISQLTENFSGRTDELKPEDVINAAKAGDEFSIQLLHNLGLSLGKGLSITIQLINPDIIVLGGPVSSANQFVLNPIQQSLNKYCLEQIVANTQIVISDIWDKSGLLGITAMLFKKLFSDMYH
ncbi:MAG TPA: ROK family transcriptional regulator [Tangfeifania sp.]|nr:ROK family transcriptional regulator [Tangfeifania sp.]